MKRAVFSFAGAGVFMFLLFGLVSVAAIPESIGVRLLFISGYFPFATTWFGVDCPNADSIPDKMTCSLMMMAGSWLVYAAIFFLFSFLIWRRRRREQTAVIDHNVAGTIIGAKD